jgi:hypothetical protein
MVSEAITHYLVNGVWCAVAIWSEQNALDIWKEDVVKLLPLVYRTTIVTETFGLRDGANKPNPPLTKKTIPNRVHMTSKSCALNKTPIIII